jgi:hypothetical protein
VEHEHLVGAQELDARYHLAKLFGLMLTNEGAALAYREHEATRERLLAAQQPQAPTPAMDRTAHLRLARSIQQRMTAAGILPPEAMH